MDVSSDLGAAIAPVNLVVVCLIAFGAVIILLGLLAGLIRVISWLFPEGSSGSDPVLVGAIQAAVARSLNGARVVRIEEVK